MILNSKRRDYYDYLIGIYGKEMKLQNENTNLPNDFLAEEILLLLEISKKTRSENHKKAILNIAEKIAEKRNLLFIGGVNIGKAAQRVPDVKEVPETNSCYDDHGNYYETGYACGWNDCRNEMLAAGLDTD